MKWITASVSFVLVGTGTFFLTGWFFLPHPTEPQPGERIISMFKAVNWAHNWWGYPLGLLVGILSAWSILKKHK